MADWSVIVSQVAILLLAILPAGYVYYQIRFRPHPRPSFRSVAVLVLGDIGRSPRMMYHSESFAQNGFETYIVGYEGTSSKVK